MSKVELTDNTAEVLSLLEQAKARALEIIGCKCETYAIPSKREQTRARIRQNAGSENERL